MTCLCRLYELATTAMTDNISTEGRNLGLLKSVNLAFRC